MPGSTWFTTIRRARPGQLERFRERDPVVARERRTIAPAGRALADPHCFRERISMTNASVIGARLGSGEGRTDQEGPP
jgi:hypothetical protein